MSILNYRLKIKFKKTSLGILFTSFYGYLPYLASFLFISNNIDKVNFNKKLLSSTLFLLSVLFSSYLFTLNINIFRVIGLVFLNLFLYTTLVNRAFETINIEFLTNRLFNLHSLIILLSFFSPGLNKILSSSDEGTSRIAGLVGYDYMAFFYCTYLFAEYRCLKHKINNQFIFKVLLSCFFILISGRFGIVILIYFLSYVFLRKLSLLKIFLIFLLSVGLTFLFTDRMSYLISSYRGFISYLIDGNTDDLFELSSQGSDVGYYSASPITWLNSFIKPFTNVNSYWFPNKIKFTIDPGPTYLIMNIGFILTFLVYYYFTEFFKVGTRIFWPLFIVFILSDLKFRGLFVPACMFWLYLNIQKIHAYEKNYNKS